MVSARWRLGEQTAVGIGEVKQFIWLRKEESETCSLESSFCYTRVTNRCALKNRTMLTGQIRNPTPFCFISYLVVQTCKLGSRLDTNYSQFQQFAIADVTTVSIYSAADISHVTTLR